MIKLLHKIFRQAAKGGMATAGCLVKLLSLLVVLGMLGFGISYDFLMPKNKDAAIVVDDIAVSHSDFQRYKNSIEDNFRKRYAAYLPQAIELLKPNFQEMAEKQMVEDILVERFEDNMGISYGDKSLKSDIVAMFGGEFSNDAYERFLKSEGLPAEVFEREQAKRGKINQVREFIADLSSASKAEAKSLYVKENTKYSAKYVEFKPADYVSKVERPDDETLKKFYDANNSDFVIEPSVSYKYVIFNPDLMADIVEVDDGDVEFYYTEHEADFTEPEKVKIQVIRLSLGAIEDAEDSVKEAALEDLKKRADEIRKEAMAEGADFTALVEKYSDDEETKAKGGELGWFSRGEETPHRKIVSAAFAIDGNGVAENVEMPNAIFVVNVAERAESKVKPLEDVKPEIVAEIKKADAPSWVSAKAEEYFDEWTKGNDTLEKFAGDKALTVGSSNGFLKAGADPDNAFMGLTEKVLDEVLSSKKLFIDGGKSTAIVEVVDNKETEIKKFDEIKDEVFEKYSEKEAPNLAAEAARNFLKSFTEKNYTAIEDAAKAVEIEVKEANDMRFNGATYGPFANKDAANALYAAREGGKIPENIYNVGDTYYVYQVTKVEQPDMAEFDEEKQKSYQTRATDNNAKQMYDILIADLRAATEVKSNVSAE